MIDTTAFTLCICASPLFPLSPGCKTLNIIVIWLSLFTYKFTPPRFFCTRLNRNFFKKSIWMETKAFITTTMFNAFLLIYLLGTFEMMGSIILH